MKPLPVILLAAACLASAPPVCATSVVSIRSPDAIVIAADSLLTVKGETRPEMPSHECKIIRSGGVFFSMTGFVRDPARQYDAVRLTAEALERTVPPRDPLAAVSDAVKRGLADELLRLELEAPELYAQASGQRGALLKLLLSYFDRETPKVAVLGFSQARSPSGEISINMERTDCPGSCDAAGTSVFILGDRRPIDAYLNRGKGELKWREPEKIAQFLVELVIDAGTPDVGPPVDVVRIDAGGAHWVERNEKCPDMDRSAGEPDRENALTPVRERTGR